MGAQCRRPPSAASPPPTPTPGMPASACRGVRLALAGSWHGGSVPCSLTGPRHAFWLQCPIAAGPGEVASLPVHSRFVFLYVLISTTENGASNFLPELCPEPLMHGDFCPPGHWAVSGDISDCHDSGAGCYWHLVGRSQGCC